MTVNYAVTFEFETRAPVTHRGTVRASSVATAARRAVLEGQRLLKPVGWCSMNFVILERAEDGLREGRTAFVESA